MKLLSAVGPHIAQGLRAALLLKSAQGQGGTAACDRPGLLVLAPDCSIAAATPEGERLLAELAEGRSNGELPQAVQTVVIQLRALEAPRGDEGNIVVPPPRVHVRTALGRWLVVHASRLTGPSAPGDTAVLIEPTASHELAPLLLRAYGLTSQEAQVTQLVLRGVATDGIAAALSISPLTVQQHLKSIFDKTGVSSRRELAAQVFASQYRPM